MRKLSLKSISQVKQLASALIGVAAFGALAGCGNTHVAVDAKSNALASYASAASIPGGHLNTPTYDVGDLLEFDPLTHKLWKAGEVQVRGVDIAYSLPDAAGKHESFGAPLDLTFDGKCSESLRSQVREDVSDRTVLHVDGTWSRRLKEPAIFIAGSDGLKKHLQKLHTEQPGDQFFLVSAVTSADKLYLQLDGTKADTLHADKHDFAVHFVQNNELAKRAKEHTAFFHLTPLKLATVDGQTVAQIDRHAADPAGDLHFAPAVASAF